MKKQLFFLSKLLFSGVMLLTSKTVGAQAPRGLQVSQTAPDFSSKDQTGNLITLKSLLKTGNVVLVFYRGEWCPYCNKYLKELEESLLKINSKKASVIAVTPEKPEYIDKSIEKTKASFPILHDEGLKIMKSYDVAYKLDEGAIKKYKKINVDLNLINGPVNSENLPVPAVYVINKQGIIVYKYFDPDYTNRAPISTIMKYL
jgi:peroxiredoxin